MFATEVTQIDFAVWKQTILLNFSHTEQQWHKLLSCCCWRLPKPVLCHCLVVQGFSKIWEEDWLLTFWLPLNLLSRGRRGFRKSDSVGKTQLTSALFFVNYMQNDNVTGCLPILFITLFMCFPVGVCNIGALILVLSPYMAFKGLCNTLLSNISSFFFCT